MEYLQYIWSYKYNKRLYIVLNLIINGIPSILGSGLADAGFGKKVLNLIINGIPSIQKLWKTLNQIGRLMF